MLSMANMKRLYGFDEEGVKAQEGVFHLLKTGASFPTKVQKGFDKMMPDSFERSPSASKRTEPDSEPVEKPLEQSMEAMTLPFLAFA